MTHRALFFLGLLLFVAAVAAQSNNPVANPNAILLAGNARFTVLTSRLIRMEYDPSGQFEDKASYVFVNRNLTVPTFTSATNGNWLTITTENIVLRYNTEAGPFENNSVSAVIDGGQFKWAPHMPNSGNLLGTVRTLDTIDGSLPIDCKNQPKWDLFCAYGLVSRDGWVIVNDTQTTLFNGDSDWDWVEPRSPRAGQSDWYLFAHGHDYRGAMKDYTKVAGGIPLPPRSTFGIFFSRYWAYSDVDFKDLVREYETNDVPLDMLVMDMDWHITFYKEARQGKKDQANQTIGWTGYTFDPHLFPNPSAFLSWLNEKGIHATMNLHPASGVQPWEEFYPEMANAMGIDPSTQNYVPFHITNKQFATNLMDIMLKPLEEMGIRFWWLDWQQWQYTEVVNMNPTAWLNYVFITNYARVQSQERPVILHRWGGLGNHKFPWGFSGDVVPTWASLQFQPYFTHTAANVGYMWSHDIGGHTRPSPPELYTRWVQWGIFSPVFRPHCTKDADNDRRIWIYPYENFKIMKDAFHLRERMIPYIYTYARKTHDTGITFLYPMYYDYSEFHEAYSFRDQYMFGEQLLVSPILTPMDNVTMLSEKTVWLPPGNWVEWSTGREYVGPMNLTRYYTLDEIPVFAKSGTIMPMRGKITTLLGQAQKEYTDLHFKVFLGSVQGGYFNLYEDEGNNIDYTSGASATTKITYTFHSSSRLAFSVDPSVGSYSTHPATRSYTIELSGIYPASSVSANGVNVPYDPNPDSTTAGWRYDGKTLSLVIRLPNQYSTSSKLTVNVGLATPVDSLLTSGVNGCLRRLEAIKVLCDYNFPQVFQEDYTAVTDGAGYANVMTYTPSQVPNVLANFQSTLTTAINQVKALNLPWNVQQSASGILSTC